MKPSAFSAIKSMSRANAPFLIQLISDSPTHKTSFPRSAGCEYCMSFVVSCPGLAAKRFGRAHVDGAEILVNRQHYREADDRFGCRQHDDENREDLAVVAMAPVVREREVVDVRGVQDQLDAHEDADRVTAGQHAKHPKRKYD